MYEVRKILKQMGVKQDPDLMDRLGRIEGLCIAAGTHLRSPAVTRGDCRGGGTVEA